MGAVPSARTRTDLRPRGVAVLGAGGQALEISSFCPEAGLEVACFLDEPGFAEYRRDLPAPVYYSSDDLPAELRSLPALLAVGSPALRRRWVSEHAGREWATLVHPAAWRAESAQIGIGGVLAPLAMLGPEVRLAEHVLVNGGASIHHGTTLGAYTTLGPGARIAGNVTIGAGVIIGIGASVLETINIGDGAVIAAGAVVTSDVPPLAVAAGVPAREQRTLEDWA
jgi:sugar O-acyltransferase (sialic acid O-acetyltransferase NeuD family)